MATAAHCAFCFDVLVSNLDSKSPKAVFPAELKVKEKFPLFVTWKKRHNGDENDYRLRGCIGTFTPQELASGLQSYAITSALKDSRFSPVKSSELSSLSCDVSLLTNFEPAIDVYDWKVGQHGIQIEFVCPVSRKSYSATYLPEVAEEQGWSRSETLRELIAKSGYNKAITSQLYEAIKLTRYQSSKASLTFAEYQKYKATRAAAAPLTSPAAHLTTSPVHLHIDVRKEDKDRDTRDKSKERKHQHQHQPRAEPLSAVSTSSASSASSAGSGSSASAKPTPSPSPSSSDFSSPTPMEPESPV